MRRGDILYEADTQGELAYVSVRGLLKSRMIDPFGREVITQVFEAGAFFGIEAIFDKPYTSTVQAIEFSAVCGVNRRLLKDTSPEGRALVLRALRSLSEQLVIKDTALRDFALKSAKSRAAAVLLSRTREHVVDGEGHRVVTPDMPRQDLAALAGMTTETFIRILSMFRSKGIVHVAGRRITLLDNQRLSSIAGVPASSPPLASLTVVP